MGLSPSWRLINLLSKYYISRLRADNLCIGSKKAETYKQVYCELNNFLSC